MKQERTIIGGLLLLQLVLWLGFLVHRSPAFPGSLVGGLLAIAAALLMVVPSLFYAAAKRITAFKEKIRRHVSLGTLLTWHIYTAIIGSIMAILHTGHRFESNLGIWLTTMMMLTVFSGFIGRYFLAYSSKEMHEKKYMLNLLAYEYNKIISELSEQPKNEIPYAASRSIVRWAMNSFFGTEDVLIENNTPLSVRAVRLAESIADVEYAIRTHEAAKRRMWGWLIFHIATSCAFYLLLTFHIWSAIYFGLRWIK